MCDTRIKPRIKMAKHVLRIYVSIYIFTYNANWQPTNKILGNESLNQTDDIRDGEAYYLIYPLF